MPIFISYSHADREFVEKMAAHLVKHKTNVWVDTWELNVGDSILDRIQEAIQGSSALLIVLSQASTQSEWCRKELSAGLIRELDEKRIIVLPVLIEDCDIPVFLRDKMYADMRHDFDSGLKSILDAVARVTNDEQGRITEDDGNLDWAQDWGFNDGLFHMRFTIVSTPESLPMTFLTQIYVFCNEAATSRYRQYEEAGLDWVGRANIAEILFDLGDKKEFQVILDSQFAQTVKTTIQDPNTGASYDIIAECRKLGQDNGKDQLVNISDYLKGIREYVRSVSRQLTAEEVEKMREIMAKPWDA